MTKPLYGERDYTFGQAMLTLRANIGLTQTDLAELLGVSRRAVGEWEAGSSYPKGERLKRLIELGIEQQAFPAGRETQAIRDLWQASHQKTMLDEQWLSALLTPQYLQPPLTGPQILQTTSSETLSTPPPASGSRVDWGDALEVPIFYGREQEIAQLSQWILQERCRVVSLLGMGGIGKSALAVHLMYLLAEHFEVVIFRSLRDAPSCEELLDDCLQVLSPQPIRAVPTSLERRISLLLEHLRRARALLVLDNLESLLQEADVQGRLRPGLEGYGRLLRRVAETAHQSCLLLTSREKPAELRPLEGKRSLVRSLRLPGLDTASCEQLLAENDVVGSQQDQIHLVEAYAGNPLALKIVTETIADLFGGEIGQFLTGGTVIFGTITNLLHEHVTRLSPLEQTILYWLAIVREPVTLDELLSLQFVPQPRVQMLEAIDGLRRRSLIERGQRQGSFTLQSVVLEYVTTLLIEEVIREIQHRQLRLLIQHGLEQASTSEYVRQAQERLLIAPILTALQSTYLRRDEVEAQLLSLLEQLRARAEYAQGYGPGNLITLLRLHRGHLRDLDLSHLVIRETYLQGIEMQDTSLVDAMIRDSIFTEVLNAPWSAAISRNGEYWAAGSMQGEIHVWRKGIQTLHLTWQAHTDTTIALSFSPDERTLASGSWDGSVKLWEVESGALCWEGWHTRSVNSVAFAPDGHLLASGGNDVGVRLWDPRSGTMLQTLPHPHPVYAVAWSPDGHWLASGDFNGGIRLWDMQQTPPVVRVEILSAHNNWVPGLAFAPDGKTLASASWDQTVKLWELPGGRLLQTHADYAERVNRVVWSSDGHTLASCSIDGMIWLWDVEQGSYRAVFHGHSAPTYGLAIAPDNYRLLSSSEDGTLRVWDVISGRCIHAVQGYAVSFYDVDWSPDGTQLVSGGTDKLVTIWDVQGGPPLRVLRGHNELIFGLTWSLDSRLIASSGWDNSIRLWDPATGSCVQILQNLSNPKTAFHGVAWSPDGKMLASGTDEHGLYVWNVSEHRQQWIRERGSVWIYDVAWSPDGTQLASTTDDGKVTLWNAQDGTLLQVLQGHRGIVNGIVWNAEGNRLVSCSGEAGKGELCVWNIESGEREREIAGFPGVVYAVAWDTTEHLVISGGSDGILRWWDIQSGQCVRERETHQGAIQALKVSPNGKQLASCEDNGTIMLWDLHSAQHLRTLQHDRPCERLNITGIKGLTEAQKNTLKSLGAIEHILEV
jgi:WD40 repeat protein/transcriptional regulator with XRE-family HTH domain